MFLMENRLLYQNDHPPPYNEILRVIIILALLLFSFTERWKEFHFFSNKGEIPTIFWYWSEPNVYGRGNCWLVTFQSFSVYIVQTVSSHIFPSINTVAYPEASRRRYTGLGTQLCAQIKEKLMQNSINYLIISSA